MRHFGSISQVNIVRDRMLLQMFREAKRQATWPTDITKLCRHVSQMPTKEFYISDESAIRYIRAKMNNNACKKFSNSQRQLLYETLYERVMELRQTERYKNASLEMVVQAAMLTQAPCLGLTPKFIYMTLRKYGIAVKRRKTKA